MAVRDRFDGLPSLGAGHVVRRGWTEPAPRAADDGHWPASLPSRLGNVHRRHTQYFSRRPPPRSGHARRLHVARSPALHAELDGRGGSMCVSISADRRQIPTRRLAFAGRNPPNAADSRWSASSSTFTAGAVTGLSTFDLRMFQNLTLSRPSSGGSSLRLRRVQRRQLSACFTGGLSAAGSEPCRHVPLLLAAVFFKIGTFGFLRLSMPLLPDATRFFAPVVVGLSAMGSSSPRWPRLRRRAGRECSLTRVSVTSAWWCSARSH